MERHVAITTLEELFDSGFDPLRFAERDREGREFELPDAEGGALVGDLTTLRIVATRSLRNGENAEWREAGECVIAFELSP